MKIVAFLIALAAFCSPGPAIAQATGVDLDQELGNCGSLRNSYGPYDYRIAHPSQKHIVEHAHFTPPVERLTRGSTGHTPGADIAYTLVVFPNHARALFAMESLVDKGRANPPVGVKLPIECYYRRAIAFTPDDHVVRMLYVNFLLKRRQDDEARKHLEYVVRTTQDNPLAQLNSGRIYVDMKDYDKALVQAHRLMEMGYDRPELREALRSVGRWVDPVSSTPPTPAASAASASN